MNSKNTSHDPYKISGKTKLQNRYENPILAENYIRERFHEPLWKMAHQKQIDFINKELARNTKGFILDLATGPARIASDIDTSLVIKGFATDYSNEMLKIASRRLLKDTWSISKADAFNLPFKKNSFDVITTFRFLRHYTKNDRTTIFTQIKNALKPQGILLFDALNKDMLRGPYIEKFTGAWDKSIFDQTYTWNDLVDEMYSHGFEPIRKLPVINDWKLLLNKQNMLLDDKIPLNQIINSLKSIDTLETGRHFLWVTSWRYHA